MIRWLCCLCTLLAIGGYAAASGCYVRSRVVYSAPAYVAPVVKKEVLIANFVAVPLYGAVFTPPVAAAAAAVPAAPAAAPAASAPNGDLGAVLKAIEALNANVQALDRRLQSVEKSSAVPPGASPPPAAPTPPGPKPGGVDPFNPGPKPGKVPPPKPVEKEPDGAAAGPRVAPPPAAGHGAKCAACHEKAVAKEKGGGRAFYDGGQLAALTDAQVRAILLTAYEGKTKSDQSMPPADSGIAPLTDQEVGELVAALKALK